MTKNVIIVVAMLLSVTMVFGGAHFLSHSGSFVTECIPYLAGIIIHAPDGSEYDLGHVFSEIGHDIAFAFLFEAPQLAKTLISFIFDGRVYQADSVSTVDKTIYFIQELILCIQDPERIGRYGSGHQGGI